MNRRFTDRAAFFSRFDLLHPRNIVVLSHAGFGLVCFLRPNLHQLYVIYAPFGPLPTWGVICWALACIMFLAPRASLLLILGQLVSAGVLWLIAGLLTWGGGLLPTGITLFGLGFTSFLLFARSLGQWLPEWRVYQRWADHPPRWLVKTRLFQALKRRGDRSG